MAESAKLQRNVLTCKLFRWRAWIRRSPWKCVLPGRLSRYPALSWSKVERQSS